MLTNYLISDIFTYKKKEVCKLLPDYDVIGRRIKTARLEQNITQEELADKIDVSIAFMSRVERGTSKINLKRLTQNIINILVI